MVDRRCDPSLFGVIGVIVVKSDVARPNGPLTCHVSHLEVVPLACNIRSGTTGCSYRISKLTILKFASSEHPPSLWNPECRIRARGLT